MQKNAPSCNGFEAHSCRFHRLCHACNMSKAILCRNVIYGGRNVCSSANERDFFPDLSRMGGGGRNIHLFRSKESTGSCACLNDERTTDYIHLQPLLAWGGWMRKNTDFLNGAPPCPQLGKLGHSARRVTVSHTLSCNKCKVALERSMPQGPTYRTSLIIWICSPEKTTVHMHSWVFPACMTTAKNEDFSIFTY